jgi:hypothetical protein
MRVINLYSFHRGLSSDRFDSGNTNQIINDLNKKYKVIHHDLVGDGSFIFNGEPITHGSILIFEFEDTKEFKIFEFGDYPEITTKLCKHEKFSGASIGQYNKQYWDEILGVNDKRSLIKPSIYPDTYWQFGIENYESIQVYRSQIELDNRLYWRGSIYKDPSRVEFDRRKSIEILSTIMESDLHYGNFPIPFDYYIRESINFRLALCFGVGGGYACGDFCFRDMDFYGIGIPTIRPKYAAETKNPLIPNVHYIAVDCEFDSEFRYKNPHKLAQDIKARYDEVIHDTKFLAEISKNAHQWYVDNLGSDNITNIILKSIDL